MTRKKIYAIGLMSGTSLDGLDLAWCRFTKKRKNWSFKLMAAKTVRYKEEWKTNLGGARNLSGESLMKLHSAYGHWTGQTCREFIKEFSITKLDLIASHGHTVFHQPQNRFTFQLGDGNAIFSETRVPIVFDFRSLDVQYRGQGAPLVPVGDHYLFGDYDVCLNLGGIANLSMEQNKQRVAFDICFANMALNYLASEAGLEFDRDGQLARKGKVHESLLRNLNGFYEPFQLKRPALAREQFENGLLNLIADKNISIEDRIRTCVESIAFQIALAIPRKKSTILITGGGAKNEMLLEALADILMGKAKLVLPTEAIIDFKEAIVFAFLGVLKVLGKDNVLKSVTRAKRNSSSGVIVR